jgi:hypothetical protein
MPPKTHEYEKDNEQIVVTLALIQKALEDNTTRISDHHKALFGNGSPENSIVWAIKNLTIAIENFEKLVEKYHKEEQEAITAAKKMAEDTQMGIKELKSELEKFKNNDENLSWKQWFKKITIKWLPIFLLILSILITFHNSLLNILLAFIKLLQ